LTIHATGRNNLKLNNDLSINEHMLRNIVEQACAIYSHIPLNTIVIEGKVMNRDYPIEGVMAIDVYHGYNKRRHSGTLSHQYHIESFAGL
jgi:hypothetical protein